MRNIVFTRLLYAILLFASALYVPWWVVVSLLLFGAMLFEQWYECIVVGICMDILYGTSGTTITNAPILFTLFGMIVYGINNMFKNFIRI